MAHFLYGMSEKMGSHDIVATLTALLTPTIEGLGCEVWGIEYLPQGSYSSLRIFIDTPSGATLEDCEKVSRQVSALLDVEDPINGHYQLEVSSPGIERPLFTRAQYLKYVGQMVKIRTQTPIDKRRKFQGILTEVTDEDVILKVEDELITLPWSSIDKAQLCWNDE